MSQEPKSKESEKQNDFLQWLQELPRSLPLELARWMPLGLTSSPVVSFAFQQEWVKALMLSPTMLISAVWGAYSKNFIERMSEIYAERGKTGADGAVANIDRFSQALKEAIAWQFSGFDHKYLKLQAKLVEEYITEGFNPDKTTIPMLEEVFVPLELTGELSDQNLKIWDLIRRSRREKKFRQMVIRKKGGYGKTTLLKHITLIYGQGRQGKYQAPKLIPFLIVLRDWKKENGILSETSLPNLAELITNYHLPKISKNQQRLKPPSKWADFLLNHGKALVMFDGFDELPEDQRQRVSYWISEQMQEYDQTVFILTSRPAGYEDYVGKRPATPLTIQELSPSQQADFVERWYLCQERCYRSDKQIEQAKIAAKNKSQDLISQLTDLDRPELQEFAKNPLLLNMVVTFHRFSPSVKLPRRRIELYKQICKLQLEDRPEARGIKRLLASGKSQEVLQLLALDLVKQNKLIIARKDLLDFLGNQSILSHEEVNSVDFLREVVNVGELLVERELGEYEFPHFSFQGYLAASRLEQQGEDAYQTILDNWDKASWRETILFYTAQLPATRFTAMLEQVCNMGTDAAKLAYDCLREYRSPEKLEPTLEDRLKALTGHVNALLYQNLEEYLKKQEWYEADQETWKLMCKISDREDEGFLDTEHIEAFPCEDLRKIDQLWVNYSNSKFGFSIQKKLWLECGGEIGKYDYDVWKKFAAKVGWYHPEKDDWRTYTEFMNDTKNAQNSLPASLPIRSLVSDVRWGLVLGLGFLVERFTTLFSHPDL
jgi:hypothetical protein